MAGAERPQSRRGGRPAKWSRELIMGMYDDGLSFSEIGRQLDMSHSTVSYHVQNRRLDRKEEREGDRCTYCGIFLKKAPEHDCMSVPRREVQWGESWSISNQV